MRRSSIAVALAAFMLVVTPVSAADYPLPLKREKEKYSGLYYAVKKAKGKPGRNIRKHGMNISRGVRSSRVVRPASAREMAAEIRRLRTLLPYRPVGGILAAIRSCESGGNYRTNTGNGFFGAYQFAIGTWHAYGGRGMPHLASPKEQDRVAMNLYRAVGTHTSASWPNCP